MRVEKWVYIVHNLVLFIEVISDPVLFIEVTSDSVDVIPVHTSIPLCDVMP